MASNPPAQCCAVGVVHEGEAKGELTTVGNTPTYVAYPKDKSTSNAILILTDVIGYKFVNAQLIADQYAANGYFVVMPDLFNDDPVPVNRPEGFQIMEWLKNHYPTHVDPIIGAVLKEMRGSLGCNKIGGVGYCFGGKYVARFLKPGMLDVGYTAHPSFMEEDELKGIKRPLSISAAETDLVFTKEKRQMTEEVLRTMDVDWQINLFSGVEHGFAVRCDLSKRRQKFAKEQVFFQAVQWFDHHLKQ